MPSVKPPYFGAAYYPEDWPWEQINEDIKLMKAAGMNVMRVAEFAWSSMEPEEGKYDFAWLHLVVQKLTEAGIGVIMCTPTCTPPAWLATRYPEILLMDDQGVRAQHGARRHACPNSARYREYCARIVTRLAEEFGHHDSIIGWQIDNELYPGNALSDKNRGCCCPECVKKFRGWVKGKYHTVEGLNRAWGTSLWSQTYQSFEQVTFPRGDTWHHPSLKTDWMSFQSDSYVDFCDHQAHLLHRLTKHPVGTDMMPFNGLNYFDIHRNLDVVQFNHYNDAANLWKAVFWMDLLRPLKPVPFWNTETSTCWTGDTTSHGCKPEGFCRANSWLPFALGGEANLYWLWRTHWSGQELMHGGVVASSGRPYHTIHEIREIAAGLKHSAEFLTATKPVTTGLALHCSGFAWLLFAFQPQVRGLVYGAYLQEKYYDPLIRAQLRPDIIDPGAELDAYKMVCSPLLPALEEKGLKARLRNWIEQGGTWVAGPLSDNRDLNSSKYTKAPFSVLEEWGGVYCQYQIPGDPQDFNLRLDDGTETRGSVWYDGFELKGATALATYTDGPLQGLAAVTRIGLGKGQVVILGTLPEPAALQKLLVTVARAAGVTPVAQASDNLLVVPRCGAGGTGAVVVEIRRQSGTLTLTQPVRDLISGRELKGTVTVGPYAVMVLKE